MTRARREFVVFAASNAREAACFGTMADGYRVLSCALPPHDVSTTAWLPVHFIVGLDEEVHKQRKGKIATSTPVLFAIVAFIGCYCSITLLPEIPQARFISLVASILLF